MGVADLGALEEARAPHHRVGDGHQDEALLEGAHLEGGPDQDGHVSVDEGPFVALASAGALNLLGHQPALGLAVPDAAHQDLGPALGLGPKGLAQPAPVGSNQAGGRAQDVGRGAVVALQPDDLGAREVLFETQDVIHLGAPPAIDRLVVVAHAADIAPGLAQEAQPEILGDVGVLVLVDQDVAEAAVVLLQDVRPGLEQGQVVQEEVAEVAGVQHPQALLIGPVEVLDLVAGKACALPGGQLFRRPAAVLPVVDQAGQGLGRPPLHVDVGGLHHLLDQALLVVGIEDGEGGLQAHDLGMPAQDLGGDGVEGAQPAQPLGRRPDQMGDAFPHFPGRLVGEGDGQKLPRPCLARGEDVGQPCRQDPRLARARPGQHQHRPLGRLHRQPLLGVQPGEIVGGRPARRRTRRQLDCRALLLQRFSPPSERAAHTGAEVDFQRWAGFGRARR